MNNTQRKQIQKWIDTMNVLHHEIDNMKDDEEYKYDNLPEGLQESEKGEAINDAVDNLESVLSSLEETISYLEDARDAGK